MQPWRLSNTLMVVVFLFTGVVASPEDSSPAYSSEISWIFAEHCVECHRPGQVAPMSLLTYAEVRPWAKAIRQSVATRRMPPFGANGPIGRFEADPRLSNDEIQTILRWVDSGSRKGDPSDLPPARTWNDEQWPVREPDLIIEFPPHTLRSDKKDEYTFLISDYIFPEDTWIQGSAWRSTNYGVVHHASAHLVEADTRERLGRIGDPDARIGDKVKDLTEISHFYPDVGWLPGQRINLLREGQALKFGKGERLIALVHFAPSEESSLEVVRLGLYFANGPITKVTREMTHRLPLGEIDIPPGEREYRAYRTDIFETDALVTHFFVHMHYLGRAFQIRLTYPDGRESVLLDVPRYDFNWQWPYSLAEPEFVPRGTKVEFMWEWDNSEANPFRPNPARRVRGGPRSIDEMGGSIIFYTVPGVERDDAFIARDGRPISRVGGSD